jgi:uncharacterized protein (TIGR02270 family)
MIPARPVIAGVLAQHCEEAAFCWLRREEGLWSPLFRQEHLARIDWLLDAHLEGLRVAGAAAIAPALQNLQRWKTPDEAFVSTYVLLHSGDETGLGELEGVLRERPELAPGASAALLWAAPDASIALLQRWWTSREPVLRRAAIPAAMRHPRVKRDTVVLDGLESADAALRASALRAAGEWRMTAHRERLLAGLSDAAPECRFEAACALGLWGDAIGAQHLGDALPALQDDTRRRAVLAWAVLASSQHFADIFNRLLRDSDWHRDLIRALAWRGDPAGFTQLLQWMETPQHSRLAAYALSHVSGMDLEADELWREDEDATPAAAANGDDDDDTDDAATAAPPDDDDEHDEHDEDAGLLQPDSPRVNGWLQAQSGRFNRGQRYLAGAALAQAPLESANYTMPQHWQCAVLRAARGEAGALYRLAEPAL